MTKNTVNLLDMTGREVIEYMETHERTVKGHICTETRGAFGYPCDTGPKMILALADPTLINHIHFLVDLYFQDEGRTQVIRDNYFYSLESFREADQACWRDGEIEK